MTDRSSEPEVTLPAKDAYEMMRVSILRGLEQELGEWARKRFRIALIAITVAGFIGIQAIGYVVITSTLGDRIDEAKLQSGLLTAETERTKAAAKAAIEKADSATDAAAKMRVTVDGDLEAMRTTATSELEILLTTATYDLDAMRAAASGDLDGMKATAADELDDMRLALADALDEMEQSVNRELGRLERQAGELNGRFAVISNKIDAAGKNVSGLATLEIAGLTKRIDNLTEAVAPLETSADTDLMVQQKTITDDVQDVKAAYLENSDYFIGVYGRADSEIDKITEMLEEIGYLALGGDSVERLLFKATIVYGEGERQRAVKIGKVIEAAYPKYRFDYVPMGDFYFGREALGGFFEFEVHLPAPAQSSMS